MLRLLDKLEELLVMTLIAAATTVIFVAVVHRYGLTAVANGFRSAKAHEWTALAEMLRSAFLWLKAVNLTWAQELCIFMFVWMAKFGAAYGVRTGIHVGVDVAINKMSKERRKAFVLFGLLAGALFTGIIATMGANFVRHMAHTDAVSPDLEIPMWIVYLAIPLGSSLMCFRFLQVAWSYARTGELPHHDHGHVDGMDEDADAPATPAAGRA